ncbi:MAG: type II toxin-antitoxin system RelE/ParE family toxin [Cyanobacteria bacterium P01_D01_bin.1]
MTQEPWEVQRYVDKAGVCPFEDWLSRLDPKTQTRIAARLDRIVDGNFGDCKSLRERLYELRFFFGPGYRIYYGIVGRRIVLLLAGGDKKDQTKTIKTAKRLLNDYRLNK